MGHELKRVNLRAKDGEQLNVNIKVHEEKRAIIHGVVVDKDNSPIKNAVVLLFRNYQHYDPCKIEPYYSAFTDDCGQFVFGPITPDEDYTIKVWANGSCIFNIYK